MLILNPASVRFKDTRLDHVSSVAVERHASRLVEEWSDAGPHAVLADCPEQRARLRIVRHLLHDDPAPPAPGDAGLLRLVTSPSAADAGRRELRAHAVLIAVAYSLAGEPGRKAPGDAAAPAAVQTLTFALVSDDGAADPISIIQPAPPLAP